MRHDSDLSDLGPIVEEGDATRLRRRMLEEWPPSEYLTGGDAVTVATLLNGIGITNPKAATPLYEVFAERIRDVRDDVDWLKSIMERAIIVRRYEGIESARHWLEESAAQLPYQQGGMPLLTAGRLLVAEGRPDEALPLLRSALDRSLTGVRWFVDATLQALQLCHLRRGSNDLSFEYVRAALVNQFQRGEASAQELLRASQGLASLFGQIDYAIELQLNIARRAEREARARAAALALSNAALMTAAVGAAVEASSLFNEAATVHEGGDHAADSRFATMCRLLARFVDPAPVDAAAIAAAAGAAAGAVEDVRRPLVAEAAEGAVDPAAWHRACLAAWPDHPSENDVEGDLVFAYLAALVARSLEENGRAADAAMLYATLIQSGYRVASSQLALERHIRLLLRTGRAAEAEAVCGSRLQPDAEPWAQFPIAALQAVSRLAQGDRRGAYDSANSALNLWRRVLLGTYDPQHKAAWLERGEECFAVALGALRLPLDGVDEASRSRRLFELVEESKSRVIVDMLARRGYTPGPYLIDQIEDRSVDTMTIAEEDPDWSAALRLQMVIFADGIVNWTYETPDGPPAGFQPVDVEPLRTMLHVSPSDDRRLLVTTATVGYDQRSGWYDAELYQHLGGQSW